jgi:hypothetical protein
MCSAVAVKAAILAMQLQAPFVQRCSAWGASFSAVTRVLGKLDQGSNADPKQQPAPGAPNNFVCSLGAEALLLTDLAFFSQSGGKS